MSAAHNINAVRTATLTEKAIKELKVKDWGKLAKTSSELHGMTQSTPAFQLMEAGDIFAPLPPVPYLIKALDIAPGAPTMIGGFGYAGKTMAAQSAALAIAAGRPLWGRHETRPGRVVHIDYEQGQHLTRQRYQRLARGMGIAPGELEGNLAIDCLPRIYLDGEANVESYSRVCEGAALLIIDSYRAACPKIDENASEARIPLDALGRVSEDTGVVVIVLHHARKPPAGGGGGGKYSLRGSGALFDACGCVLVMAGEKGEPVTVTHEKARISGNLLDDFALRIEDVERDGDDRWGVKVSAEDVETSRADRDGAALDAMCERALAVVRKRPGCKTAIVQTALKARRKNVIAALAELARTGAIQNTGSDTKHSWRPCGPGGVVK